MAIQTKTPAIKAQVPKISAKTFSKIYADVITMQDSGKDTSELFFEKYSEMIATLPYTKYFTENN